MDRQTREEMNALSKEVFGASSRWQKLLTKGYPKLLTEEVEETVPAEKEGEEPKVIKVQKPVLRADGAKQSVQAYHTVESVKEMMLALKVKRDEFLAMIAQQQKEQEEAKKKAELQEKVQSELAGAAGV